jgi:CubicO group peptidase (beta-lactamase class C family)
MHLSNRNTRRAPALLAALLSMALTAPSFADEAAASAEEEQATNVLFMSQAERRSFFAHVREALPTRTVAAGGQRLALNDARQTLPDVRLEFDGEEHSLEEFLQMPATMGMIVVQDGEILLEYYAEGHDVQSPWISFSVTKSVTSMLLGAAIHDGYIDSVDEPVMHYLPRLRGTAYEGVTIEQVLHMASGVAWNEDYEDPESDVSKAGALNGLALVNYLAKLPRAHEPGSTFNYSTGEANLIGEILRAALGNNASTYLEHKIWKPFGMAFDAYWLLDREGGVETGGCCINATLRDYARIGMFAMGDGVLADGTRVLPEGWMKASTTSSPAAAKYGYQWWVLEDGAYAAMGIFDQMIYVDPSRKLVVALHSNAVSAVGSAHDEMMVPVAEAIGEALDQVR